ncbi:MAG: hypothetical protein JWP02_1030 [Acidimicrobiales bacterium]|nr:hypothetical protein [Acidimicrobiales bacterium]
MVGRFGTYLAVLCLILSGGAASARASGTGVPVGVISGRVTATGSGSPLDGICVIAEPAVGGNYGSAKTGPGGLYALTGLNAGGAYRVFFYDCTQRRYAAKYWPDEPFGPGRAVTAPRSGVNAALPLGASIVGQATDDDGFSAQNVCVTTSPHTPYANDSVTDSTGWYVIGPLAPGNYKVDFGCGRGWPSSTYLERWSHDRPDEASADPVSVVADQVLQVNQQLPAPGALSGTVTDARTGSPLAGVCVTVSGPGVFGSRATRSDGTWRLEHYSVNTPLTVEFNSPHCSNVAPYVPQWWQNKPSADQADTITFTTSTPIIGGVDAQLQPAS